MFKSNSRAISSVLGIVLLVALIVILGATVGAFSLGLADEVNEVGPNAAFEYRFVDDGSGGQWLEITHNGGDPITANQVVIVASDPVDLGGSNTEPKSSAATTREKITEKPPGGPPQVGIGDQWTAGESILLAPGSGTLSGTTIKIVWNPEEIEKESGSASDEGEIISDQSQLLAEYTIP